MPIQTHHYRTSLSSLSSVILGVSIAAAIIIAFASLSLALGFGAVDAYSSNPLAGVGTALGIPSVIGLLLGLAIGAYIAGHLAGSAGYAHGLATWALLVILGAFVSSLAVEGAVRTAGSAVDTVLTSVGSAAGGIASGTGTALGAGISTLDSDILGEINWKQSSDDIKRALRNTQIESLQPEQLEKTFRTAAQNIADAVRSIAIQPGKSDEILSSLGDKLSELVENNKDDLNRDDAINALVNNGMERSNAEKAVDDAKKIMDNAREAVDQGIERAKQTVAEIQQATEEVKAKAQEFANEAASTSSTAAWWTFIAAVLGALIAAFAGQSGVRNREKYYTEV